MTQKLRTKRASSHDAVFLIRQLVCIGLTEKFLCFAESITMMPEPTMFVFADSSPPRTINRTSRNAAKCTPSMRLVDGTTRSAHMNHASPFERILKDRKENGRSSPIFHAKRHHGEKTSPHPLDQTVFCSTGLINKDRFRSSSPDSKKV